MIARALLGLWFGLNLAGCGLKDDLYLPPPEPDVTPTPGDIQPTEDDEEDGGGTRPNG